MSEAPSERPALEKVMEDWAAKSAEFWKTALETLPKAIPNIPATEALLKNRYLEALEKLLKGWQALSATMADPAAADSVLRGMSTVPEFFLRLSKAGWEASVLIHQKALETAGKIGQKVEGYRFDDIEQELLKAWREIYEEEFRRYFQIPTLGLTRYYQERLNRLVDQWNILQTTVSEFLYVLYLPVERSFQVLQDEVEAMAKEGRLPQRAKDYYNLWVKILEGHYMTLFKSPEYLSALREMLKQVDNFSVAKNQVLQDILQFLPVPTTKEMDELYRELYQLKKRVKELEKKVSRLEKAGH